LIGTGLVVSLGEGIIGYSIADRTNMSDGKACMIGVGGDFGLAIGGGAAELANFSGDHQERPIAGMVLAGAVGGMWAGNWLANEHHYTRGDAYVVRATGILGMWIPVAALGCARVSSGRTYAGWAMAGLIAGTGIGHHLISDLDFTPSQGTVITASEFAGGLFGLGLAYLMTPSNGSNPNAYFILSTAGGVGGFAATYSLFKRDLLKSHNDVSWNLDIVPQSSTGPDIHHMLVSSQTSIVPTLRLQVQF
jgi:hypothetical protein